MGARCDVIIYMLKQLKHKHRRTSHGGLGDCSPQTRAKPLFFGQKLNFSGRRQQPKMKEKHFLYLFNKKKRNLFR